MSDPFPIGPHSLGPRPFYEPPDRRFSRRWARLELVHFINELAPQVAKSLAADVFPRYAERCEAGIDLPPWAGPPDRGELLSLLERPETLPEPERALLRWAYSWNLLEPWFVAEVGLRTVRTWVRHGESGGRLLYVAGALGLPPKGLSPAELREKGYVPTRRLRVRHYWREDDLHDRPASFEPLRGFRWFVRWQMLGERKSEIARTGDVNRSVLDATLAEVAGLVGVTLRRGRPGRPRG